MCLKCVAIQPQNPISRVHFLEHSLVPMAFSVRVPAKIMNIQLECVILIQGYF